MLPESTKLISADDHVIEYPGLWLDHLPAKFRDDGPRVIKVDGLDKWRFQDELVGIESGSTRLLVGDGQEIRWVNFDEIRPGCYEPTARLADMDEDGVWGQLCFPNYARFAGHRFQKAKDPELGLACIRAYNDYLLDVWCAADRERLSGMALIPIWDLETAIAELHRAVEKGARAVGFSENPTVLGLPSVHTDHWDPLWAAVSEVDVPICMHIGSSSRLVTTSDDAPGSIQVALLGMNSIMAAVDWLFCGALERFPKFRVILSEGGAGWVPYVVERCDKVFWDYRVGRHQEPGARPPSELFAEHMYVCMVTEHFALRAIGDIPVDNLLWEGDYPHGDGLWPHNRKWLEDAMVDVDDADAVKIAETNPRRVLGIR
jgi:predicted TIM-barrel fold metal-dependent hydrolase